jgi:hypothetical protein
MTKIGMVLLYLDPGTGSLIIQFIIAGVTGAIFFFKNIREKIMLFFQQFRNKASKN